MIGDHREHLWRASLIVVVSLAVGAAYLFGPLGAEMKIRLEGSLALLLPALWDVLRVAKRQRFERHSLRPPALESDRPTKPEPPPIPKA